MSRLLLLGGGHAHLAAAPLLGTVHPRLSVAMVAPTSRLLYSGMMPGWLAGAYPFDDCAIDLEGVCRRNGIEWIRDEILDLDFSGRVAIGRRARYPFDLASINVGAGNRPGQIVGGAPPVLCAKPFEGFVRAWEDWLTRARQTPGRRRLFVIGGGAAGVELAFALAHLAQSEPALDGSSVILATQANRLLTGMSAIAACLATRRLRRAGVQLRFGLRYTGAGDAQALFGPECAEAADLVILATGARPAAWLQQAARRDGVSLARDGAIAVRADLRSVSHPYLFAAGDCASIVGASLPRSGVHALRQGTVLAANFVALADTAKAYEYRPRHWTLALLNCADGRAIGAWGPLGFSGRWAWKWKDRIDRRFIARFH